MDEILIEEKKYVSSRQAAKITGYAKDYIGQLCREGRVPARLVGRSWYVLEAAIKDHRFGETEADGKEASDTPRVSTQHHTWEPPRYESSDTESFPSINRFEAEKLEENQRESDAESPANLHESWKAWFDHIASAAPIAEITPSIEPVVADESGTKEEEYVPLEIEKEPEIRKEDEVSIPIHVMGRAHAPEAYSVPAVGQKETQLIHKSRGWGSRMLSSLRLIGILVAVVSVALAIVGSGYVDEYVVSNNQVQIFTGISTYNK